MAYECSVDGCDKRPHCKGLCPMHYQRQRIYGSLGPAEPVRRSHRGAVCAVEGCEKPRRKRDWCAKHYAAWRRHGDASAASYRWSTRLLRCLVCGAPTGIHRRFCTDACRVRWTTYEGNVPTSKTCTACGESISLTERGPGGYRRRTDVLLCGRCRQDKRKHALSVRQLANRDGTDCGICGEAVDMSLRAPELMRASVDHVIPRALGGTNNTENLQLAHLLCNVRKGHRVREAV